MRPSTGASSAVVAKARRDRSEGRKRRAAGKGEMALLGVVTASFTLRPRPLLSRSYPRNRSERQAPEGSAHRFGGVGRDRDAIDDREERRGDSDIRKALVARAAIFAWLDNLLRSTPAKQEIALFCVSQSTEKSGN